MNPVKTVWTEFYRPKKVDDIVGDFKDKIKKYLKDPASCPHFLFYSKSPGTGKTTLSKAIINELNCDYLILNSSDDRKIEVVRQKVKEFALTKSSKIGLRRVIMLDEFDGMLKASQDALRNIMETYAKNVIFILTCNNINKVIEPLKSRCKVFPFAYPKKEEIKEYLKKICESESLKYDDEGLNALVDMNYPNIRNCVLALQDIHTMGKEVNKQNVKPINEAFKQLWEFLKQKKSKDIKEAVMATIIDPRELNSFFWEQSLKEDNTRLIQLCCRNERDLAAGCDPKIIVVTSLIEMCK